MNSIATALPALPAVTALTPAVRGSTELLLVVADPVAQVKAPAAFNHVFARCGVDAVVVPARVSATHLAGFAQQSLAVGNVRGLLVSIPHKTPLMSLLQRFDPVSLAAGAVNAVRRADDGVLEGALFDGAGFLGAMQHHGVSCVGCRLLLVGAGGAGLAIASALRGSGLVELVVHDAQPARAEALARHIGPSSAHPVNVAPTADPTGFDLIVQATPVGLRIDDPMPLDVSRIEANATVIDILMTPRPTRLLAACRERGVVAHSGHEMLIQQVPAYLEFFGYGDLARHMRQEAPALMKELRGLMLEGQYSP